jgi:hypothetical protein
MNSINDSRRRLLAAAAILLGSAAFQTAIAQEYRYRYIEGTVSPSYNYGGPYVEYYEYEPADATRVNRFPATGGLAGGDSGVRNLRTQERVRAFFFDLDRTGSGGR